MTLEAVQRRSTLGLGLASHDEKNLDESSGKRGVRVVTLRWPSREATAVEAVP